MLFKLFSMEKPTKSNSNLNISTSASMKVQRSNHKNASVSQLKHNQTSWIRKVQLDKSCPFFYCKPNIQLKLHENLYLWIPLSKIHTSRVFGTIFQTELCNQILTILRGQKPDNYFGIRLSTDVKVNLSLKRGISYLTMRWAKFCWIHVFQKHFVLLQ